MNRRSFLRGSSTVLVAASSVARARVAPAAVPPGATRLRVTEADLRVGSLTGRVYRLEQDDGTAGYTGTRGQRFRVLVENGTGAPFSIHWHGLILPNGQDGVPYVTQRPIRPGQQRLYDFPIVQAGTYWMHSHFGLQEQGMMTAPLILREPAGPVPVERDVVVILNDFTVRDPLDILKGLQGKHERPGMMGQAMPARRRGGRDLADVTYDALLANRRVLADPEVVRVVPGEVVRLRIIDAASATNVFVSTGALAAEAVAVDGEDIVPLRGRTFELAIAQRIDLRVRIPEGQGAYPVLARGEGTDLVAGVILATAGASLPALSPRAGSLAGALTNAQEARLRAARPLPARPVDRTLRVTLEGNMMSYVWTLNGQTWPRITPLVVNRGERVELVFTNGTPMAHPMHLHGHVFQVTAIDGQAFPGALRDTVLVAPGQTVTAQLDAAYQGYWMIHCHVLYHQAAGMMTVLRYDGFEDRSYDPLASLAELRR
jgi:FtsP/CotA-like multicopper oxidase with cupredoxin domain